MTDTTVNKNQKKITSKIYPLDILIYQRIKYFVDQKDGFCYESNLSLSKALNRSTQRISMSISKLIKLGYLVNNGTIQQRELKITEKKLNYYFNKNDIDFNKNDIDFNKNDIDFNKINVTTLTQILLYFNKNDKETLTKAIRDFNKNAMQVLDIVLDINKDNKDKESNNINIITKENKKNDFFIFYKNFSQLKQYAEFVYIKESEYNNLLSQYPFEIIEETIKKLNLWKLEKHSKKQYKDCHGDDYRKMLKWGIKSTLKDFKELDYDKFRKIMENINKAKNPELIKKCNELVVAEVIGWKQAQKFSEEQINEIYEDFQIKKLGGIK